MNLTSPFLGRIKERPRVNRAFGDLGTGLESASFTDDRYSTPQAKIVKSLFIGAGKTPDSIPASEGYVSNRRDRSPLRAVSFFPSGNFQTQEPGSRNLITRPLNHLSPKGDGVLVPRQQDSRAKATTAASLPEMGRRRKANYG